MIEQKIAAMHKMFGSCGVFRCKDCKHFTICANGRKKCELYGTKGGEITEWRLNWQACGMFDMDVDMGQWVPVIEQLKRRKENALQR